MSTYVNLLATARRTCGEEKNKDVWRRKNPRENHLIHLCGSGESNVGRMLKYKRDNE